ncbi:hypothetical protein Y032_0022g577 [Ancylostoma ceylanicum]|uniref:Uncharacterized protein n=1 Tax=Ancylostoma ceylanicum TaxID=53326 RepID=A0A016UZA3_9BILA|nr:hypothetical protein Y032_0022g577 [Ancylostoma ceylanicum]
MRKIVLVFSSPAHPILVKPKYVEVEAALWRWHSAVSGREKRADARHSSYFESNPDNCIPARMMLNSARYWPDRPFGPHHVRFRQQFARYAPSFKPFVGDLPANGTGFAPAIVWGGGNGGQFHYKEGEWL